MRDQIGKAILEQITDGRERGHCGLGRMVVGFTATYRYAIGAYHH
jgi:hypothetical protein